ncbi:MAG TPA: GNAT family protein [Flavisolibacter sp.]|nr:GNAT family protein [Flavisolibacter sp.]
MINYKGEALQITLRPWAINDVDDLVKFANNRNVAKHLMDRFPHPYTAADATSFIAYANAADPVCLFAIDIDGRASGGVGIEPQTDIYRKNAELGYWLAEPFWGKGIMTEVIRQMVDFAFRTFAIERIFARPFGTNLASQKVLEKNGFVVEGRFEKVLFKNGEYYDELVYAIRRHQWLKQA